MPLKTRISQMNMNGKYQKAISMKKIYLLGAMALMAFTACQNIETEVPSENGNGKVPMTFVASLDMDESDSKVAVEEVDTANKKLKFAWKAGDEIAIYDNLSSTPNLFTATADGTTVAFSGSVTDGATKFVAIYPYSAAESANAETGDCVASFPREQTAVAGSFDPQALVATAYAEATDVNLRFRLLGALLSFKVDFDDVVYVEFSGSRPMTGQLSFNSAASGPSSVSTGTPNYKDVSIKNADGSPLTKGETYYVCVRHTGSNSQEGFTAKLITSDARIGSRTGSSNLQIARKTLYPLGTFSSSNISLVYDRYAVYNAGFDVTIAGKTYNKATDGDAVEVTSTSIGNSTIVPETKLYFLKSGVDYAINGYSFNSDVVLSAEDPTVRVNLKPSSTFKFLSGSVVLSGINLDLTAITSNAFSSNSGATGHFDRVAIENCIITTAGDKPTYFYQTNSSAKPYGISEIYVDGCLIPTSGKLVALFTISSDAEYATSAAQLSSFTFTNNVMYSTTGGNVKLQVFSYTGTLPSTWAGTSLVMNNNLFYNTYTSSGNFRYYDLTYAEIKNNILFATDGLDPGGNVKLLNLGIGNANTYSATSVADNNYYWGTLASGKNWSLADSKYRGENMKNTTPCSENPLSSETSLTDRRFVIVNAYSAYGPQPIPAP